MKILKFFIYMIIIVVVLSTAALAGGYYYVTHADQRVLLTKLVKKITGYTLVLEGAVTVQLLPNLMLEAEKIAVKSYSGPKESLFTADNLVARMQINSFSLNGLVLETLTLDNPNLYIHQPAKGLPNWKSPYRRGKSSAFVLPVGQMKHVQINNASFMYINEKEGKVHALTGLNLVVSGENIAATTLKAEGVLDQKPFNLNASFDLTNLLTPTFSATLKSENNTVSLDGLLAHGRYNGQLSFKTDNIQKVVRDLNQVNIFQNVAPLPLTFSAYLKMEDDISYFKNIAFSLGNAIVANGDITYDISSKLPRIVSRFTVTRADLPSLGLCTNQTQKVASTTLKHTAEKTQRAPWSDAPLDIAWARLLTLNATVTINNIRCQTNPVKSATVHILGDGRSLTLQQADITLPHNGVVSITGDVQLKNTPNVALNVVFNPLPVEVFLNPNSALKLPMTGTLNFKGTGSSSLALVKSLSGRIDLGATQGEIPTSFFTGIASEFQKLFTGQGVHTTGELENFKAIYTITKGVAKAETLELKTKDGVINMTGSGKIDLARWAINHKFVPQISTSAIGIKVPVVVRGSLNNPSILPEIVNTQNLAIGVGSIVGGPVGAAIGALLGGSVAVAPQVSATVETSTSVPQNKPLNLDFTKPQDLFNNLFNR